jgi:hypothetical protein
MADPPDELYKLTVQLGRILRKAEESDIPTLRKFLKTLIDGFPDYMIISIARWYYDRAVEASDSTAEEPK